MRIRSLLPIAILVVATCVFPAKAEPPVGHGPPDPEPPAAAEEAVIMPALAEPEAEGDYPLFPIGGRKAGERGYRLPRAFGIGGMTVHNVQDMGSEDLAITLAKGEDPPENASLIEVPFVTTDRLESHTTNSQVKADLWLFPFMNVFAALGQATGHLDIDVAIDLDAFVPPPICRPRNPCGAVNLPFEADIDNTTLTMGTILAYGSNDWFASLSLARTLSVAAKDRSDITTTDLALRMGPRLHLGGDVTLSPYAGVDHFDLDATVSGTVRSGPVIPDGDTINLRYRIRLFSQHRWAAIVGGNLELGPHWALQAEYNRGEGANRFLLSATFRP